jgi:hypothetical protein
MAQEVMTDLGTAIESLYATFARYPLRAAIPFCDHCHDAGEVALLHTKPLRQLSARDLGHVAFDLVTTFGELPEYKHLLPRLFELMAAREDELGLEPWVQAGKLAFTRWSSWPKTEQAAVEVFWRALFRHRLAQPWTPGEFEHRPDRLLYAMARAGLDITAELAHWDGDKSGNATLWLAEAYSQLGQGAKLDGEWREFAVAAGQFEQVLLDAEQPLRLQAAFHATSNTDHQQLLSYAEQVAWSLTARPRP